MEQLLQQIDPSLAIVIALGCGLLCLVGIAFSFVFQFLGLGLGIIFNILGFFGNIITGGPIAWFGCLMTLLGCTACSGIMWVIYGVIPNCGTPQALNLCRLFGY